MSEKIIQLNKSVIKDGLKELVLDSVEKTLNNLLKREAQELDQVAKYERTEACPGYRNSRYLRDLVVSQRFTSSRLFVYRISL